MNNLPVLIDFFAIYGYIAVFLVLIACGFGIPLPEDLVLIAGGAICTLTANLHLNTMVIIAISGVLTGDTVIFLLGRLLGAKVKQLPVLRWLFTKNNYNQIQQKMQRYGAKIIFIARFLPGLRAPIFITSGISHKMLYWKFILLDGSAALISVPIWVLVGYYFAADMDKLLLWVQHSEAIILSLVILAVIVWLSMIYYRSKK